MPIRGPAGFDAKCRGAAIVVMALLGVIDTHFNKVMAGLAVTIVGGFVAFRYLF